MRQNAVIGYMLAGWLELGSQYRQGYFSSPQVMN
jgi:hypothetical protein